MSKFFFSVEKFFIICWSIQFAGQNFNKDFTVCFFKDFYDPQTTALHQRHITGIRWYMLADNGHRFLSIAESKTGLPEMINELLNERLWTTSGNMMLNREILPIIYYIKWQVSKAYATLTYCTWIMSKYFVRNY